jgi:hypothetical protein
MTAPTDWPSVDEIDALDMARAADRLVDELGAERALELLQRIARRLETDARLRRLGP